MTDPISLEQAQQRLLSLRGPLKTETLPAPETVGRYLADKIVAKRFQPPADLSAMDGFATCATGPWILRGESKGGAPFAHALKSGEAIRISTGAILPQGADAILIVEEAQVTGDQLQSILSGSEPDADAEVEGDKGHIGGNGGNGGIGGIGGNLGTGGNAGLTNGGDSKSPHVRDTSRVEVGKHIRRRGFDFCAGQQLLRAGTRIGPQELALAICGGHPELTVHQLPKVALIEGGDELRSSPGLRRNQHVGSRSAPHMSTQNATRNATQNDSHIPASNSAMLKAMIGANASTVTQFGPIPDDFEKLRETFEQCEQGENRPDIIVTSGGASVGDHDLIKPVLVQWGAKLEFWRVAIRPGKPILIARKGEQIILGLPGNPVSCFVTAFLFLLPLIRHLSGASDMQPIKRSARLSIDVNAPGKRRMFIRAIWDGESVTPLDQQDSSGLLALSQANALIEIRENCTETKAGTNVPIYPLSL